MTEDNSAFSVKNRWDTWQAIHRRASQFLSFSISIVFVAPSLQVPKTGSSQETCFNYLKLNSFVEKRQLTYSSNYQSLPQSPAYWEQFIVTSLDTTELVWEITYSDDLNIHPIPSTAITFAAGIWCHREQNLIPRVSCNNSQTMFNFVTITPNAILSWTFGVCFGLNCSLLLGQN